MSKRVLIGNVKGNPGPPGPQGEPGITSLATTESPGLLNTLSGKEDEVLLGNGQWGEYHGGSGGGGTSGPMWLEVDENGYLNAYYDDGLGEPPLEYDEETGALYAIFEVEE